MNASFTIDTLNNIFVVISCVILFGLVLAHLNSSVEG